jgi:hypothetical protein
MNTSDAWCVLKIKWFLVTPIHGGVKGKVVDKNSNGFVLLLVVKVSTSSMLFLIVSIMVT